MTSCSVTSTSSPQRPGINLSWIERPPRLYILVWCTKASSDCGILRPCRRHSRALVPMRRTSRGPSSRARNSCTNCRRRHFRCSEGTPCQRCSQDALECTYIETNDVLLVKRWTPGEEGLRTRENERRSASAQGDISFRGFVSENHKIESRYQVLSPNTLADGQLKPPEIPADTDAPDTTNSLLVTSHQSTLVQTVRDSTEAFFMQRYCNIIGPWFDLFDTSGRHWTNTIPHLALADPALFTAIMASCTKQFNLVSGERSIYALDYYNRGLSELSHALGSPVRAAEASVFASCLFIGYCEMIDARSTDWQTHLRGTFSLLSDHGWHGQCGGVIESCFWVYCRMDLLASLALSQRTLLDPLHWLPSGSCLGPALQDRDGWGMDSWSNQIVVLLARTHNLLCDMKGSRETHSRLQASSASSELRSEFIRRWTAISSSLEAHERARPTPFHAVAELPPLRPDIPFPRTMYISATASAANQMLDVARFLCLLSRPGKDEAERESHLMSPIVCSTALELACKVISNSMTNRHSIAWVNAVQLLSSVGPVLPGRAERDALLRTLSDIHRETGWSVLNHSQLLEQSWERNDRVSQQDVYPQTLTGHDATLRCVGRSLLRYAML